MYTLSIKVSTWNDCHIECFSLPLCIQSAINQRLHMECYMYVEGAHVQVHLPLEPRERGMYVVGCRHTVLVNGSNNKIRGNTAFNVDVAA